MITAAYYICLVTIGFYGRWMIDARPTRLRQVYPMLVGLIIFVLLLSRLY